MDRRSHERFQVWFPMRVVTESGEEGTAITYDCSQTGLLMAAPGRLEVGARVVLRFRISPDDAEERAITGRILRVEDNDGEDGPWRHRMAVQFDVPEPALEGVLAANREPA